jgi:hypothetical protein
MKRFITVLALSVMATGLSRAQKPTPAAAPSPATTPAAAVPTAPAAPRETKITNLSAFDPNGPTTRNPFLPIGYVRPVKEAPREMILDVRPEMFSITAILLGDPPLAIINGKDRGVGDRIPLNASGTEFVLVRRISDGEVTMEYRGRLIVVPAGRKR